MESSDLGLIGLAVMGQNLVLNMERNGYPVVVFNRTPEVTEKFLTGPAAGKNIQGAKTLEEFVAALERPRIAMIMVKAGGPVDSVIVQLQELLEPDDLIVDLGNSLYTDTERRYEALSKAGIGFMGVGVSGGEEGALMGPSIMPAGGPGAWTLVQPVLTDISAKVDGEPCVTHIGPRGSGHFVKMVHNGIEYGDMQLIAEAYDLLHRGVGLDAGQLADVFAGWNDGALSSYLIEITADVLRRTDEETGKPLVEVILDVAGQKGTGRWTSQNALELGTPIPTIDAAVTARGLSTLKEQRARAASQLAGPRSAPRLDDQGLIDAVGDALYAAKIGSYAQGFAMMRTASDELGYDLDLGEIARIWRGGCIIRALFLDDVRAAYKEEPGLPNLLLAPFFRDALADRQDTWRQVVARAVGLGIPVPAMSASLAYYDAYRSERLPANLIQAQRDYFGAHTYKRLDRDGVFHTDWKKPTQA